MCIFIKDVRLNKALKKGEYLVTEFKVKINNKYIYFMVKRERFQKHISQNGNMSVIEK